jgi:type I restriction enzyme S subunit
MVVAEQQEIVRQVEGLFALADQLEQRLAQARRQVDQLRPSLLARAFAGKLVPQDANDEPASVLLERIRKQREQPTKAKVAEVEFSKTKRPKVSQSEFAIVPQSKTDNIIELRAAFDAYVLNKVQFKLGRTVLEKINHFAEYDGGLELWRHPVRDAAGPVDFPSRMKVEEYAREQNWYSCEQAGATGYKYSSGANISEALSVAKNFLGDKKPAVDRLIELLAPLTVHKCSVIATLYAAWNDLLLTGQSSSDEEIIHESRFGWHKEKEKIPTADWTEGLAWLKKNQISPKGRGKITVQRGSK